MTSLNYFNYSNQFSALDFFVADLTGNTKIQTKELLVVYWKFFELSQKISQGNYSLYNTSRISDSLAYYNLCNSILAYQACYDYMLQILFFGFGFNIDFNDSETYKKILKNDCRLHTYEKRQIGEETEIISVDTQFATDLKTFCSQNDKFKSFYQQFNKYRAYVNDEKNGISHWANCIKHQGGFITKELINSQRNHNLQYFSEDSTQYFSTTELYAFQPEVEEVIEKLINQNKKIVEIANWLFNQFFPERKIEAFHTRQLPKGTQILT